MVKTLKICYNSHKPIHIFVKADNARKREAHPMGAEEYKQLISELLPKAEDVKILRQIYIILTVLLQG